MDRQKADVILLVASRDEEEQTPLMIASREGHDGIVKLLLKDFGVYVDEATTPPSITNPAMDNLMKTPLTRKAIQSAKQSNLKRNGNTALKLASQYGHASVIELLLENGADVDLHTGSTAL